MKKQNEAILKFYFKNYWVKLKLCLVLEPALGENERGRNTISQ